MAMAKGVRLDQALVQRGFFASRKQAQSAIMAGEVRVNGQIALKPSDSVLDRHEVAVAAPPRYVGRGGLKLEGALAHFAIDCADKTALDIGASTGGFTDCLLQHGARKVYAVDVGHGQLAWKIRDDPRVFTLEKTNARSLSAAQIPEPIDICVIDVSFISLTLILPNALQLLTPEGVTLALIKPQFELGREDVGRGGIVRSVELHEKAQQKVATFAGTIGARVRGLVPSVIAGTDGNQEFFICLRKGL
ncbi:MAG TPA: TlyA family RNA methyltransferase, partial [Chthoniobacterales bacterium]|nr:TlyA family RNA methyltransferase [Chthoniobacterales bacterium]